jgi:hypothetical protein
VNEALRWTLVLGCLLLAILEAPHSVLVLVQDFRGPWRAEPPVARTILQQDRAFASVDPENALADDRRPDDRLARQLAAGNFATLLAR